MPNKNRKTSNFNGKTNKSIMNVMFLDIKGYSALRDEEVENLIGRVFPDMKTIIDKREHEHVNTWGDAVVVSSGDVREIAHIALDLRDLFHSVDWRRHGIPVLQARISLHTGTMWTGVDVFTNRTMISGRTVNLAARIEPITEPGRVWATDDFVRILSREDQPLFRASSVGRRKLPKDAGEEELFVVYRGHETDPASKGKEAAVTIVEREGKVLLVKCAVGGGPTWQFPAGQLKPNSDAQQVAVEEVFNETDVRCRIVRKISERRHPDTEVYCYYYYATWISGEVVNKDRDENVAVEWVSPREALDRFTTNVDPAVKSLLESLERSE